MHSVKTNAAAARTTTEATTANSPSWGSNCPKANYLYKKRHKAFCGTAKKRGERVEGER